MKQCLADGGLGFKKTFVVNNFATIPPQTSSQGKGLLYFGRLCREKGVDTLLQAYAKLQTPKPTLTIAGQGPLEDQLKQFAKDKGLDNIRWLGFVSPAQVKKELDSCAFIVVPSLWNENCSMCIMEGLSNSRPVVASNSGGNPELIDDGINGRVFPAGNADALSNILAELIASPNLLASMSEKAKLQAEKRFSPQVHMDNLLDIYKLLITEKTIS